MELSPQIDRFKILRFMLEKMRIFWHLMYWTTIFFILLKIFSGSENAERIDTIYTLIFLAPICLATYINLYLLVPFFLRKERVLLYTITFLADILLAASLTYLLFDQWIDLLLNNYFFISAENFRTLLIYAFVLLTLSTLLKISREWLVFLRRDRQQKLAQLKNLQAQINPHFLLNSMQTIYGMSLNKDENTPETILQLSEILKFSLYETNQSMVDLERELEVVQNYVSILRRRTDPGKTSVNLQVSGPAGKLKIIPLLFLPFIENSFKHGVQGSGKDAYVNMDFYISGNNLTFTIENSTGQADPVDSKDHQGIGIENTRQRLNAWYPTRHRLIIEKSNDTFRVKLQLKLRKA